WRRRELIEMITRNQYAIAGIGVTPQGRLPGKNDLDIKADAASLAIADTGLRPVEVDGVICQPGITDIGAAGRGGEVGKQLGLTANFMWMMQGGGTTTVAATVAACGAIEAGLASAVLVLYGDNPLTCGTAVGKPGQFTGGLPEIGITAPYGAFSP